MQPGIPPILAMLAGLIAAALLAGSVTRWLVLLHTSLSRHGGDFLGSPKRHLLPVVPVVIFLHPVPYLIAGLVLLFGLLIAGSVSGTWWWFLGGALACFSVLGLAAVRSIGGLPRPSAPGGRKNAWPLGVMRERRYQRQYRAAYDLFLVQGTLSMLPADRQAEIERRVHKLLLMSGVNAYLLKPNSPVIAPLYAAHMSALGIAPGIPGERWPLPEKFVLPVMTDSAWRLGPPMWLGRLLRKGFHIFYEYRRGGAAVDEARRNIASRGLIVDAGPPHPDAQRAVAAHLR